MTALHGWVVLDKPYGMGSTQAVGAVKRALREGGYDKAKVGHGGTLDPLASGVLPIALGEATKLAGRMLDSDKAYDFTISFGEETDTLDAEGAVVARSSIIPSFDKVGAILPRFTGAIEQLPPAYSALKVDGRRAYHLARKGERVELPPRHVTIRALRVRAGKNNEATLSAVVSKGTYIRALGRDIAQALGTVGHLTMLRRTKAGPFGLDAAISLDKLFELARRDALEDVILPMRTALADIPALALTPEQAGALRQGRVVTGIAASDGLHFAELDQIPVALVEIETGTMTVERGFNC